MGTKNHQKTLRIWDFRQNGGKNKFWFWFSAIFLFSTLNMVVLAKNLKKNFWGAFFYIFGVKVKKFQIFLKRYKNFLSAIF